MLHRSWRLRWAFFLKMACTFLFTNSWKVHIWKDAHQALGGRQWLPYLPWTHPSPPAKQVNSNNKKSLLPHTLYSSLISFPSPISVLFCLFGDLRVLGLCLRYTEPLNVELYRGQLPLGNATMFLDPYPNVPVKCTPCFQPGLHLVGASGICRDTM